MILRLPRTKTHQLFHFHCFTSLFSTTSIICNAPITEQVTIKPISTGTSHSEIIELQSKVDKLVSLRHNLRVLCLNENAKPQSTLVNEKLNFLLNNLPTFDIFDLKLSNQEMIELFLLLIERRINFNEVEIPGIGKLLKKISNISDDVNIGLEIIQSCGILNARNKNNNDDRKDEISSIFRKNYNDTLRMLTIDILIQHKRYNEAHQFLQLIDEQLSNDTIKKQIIKYRFKLSKMKEFDQIKPSLDDILESNNVHIYLRELTKRNNLTPEKKLEYHLLILYKYLKLANLKSIGISNNELLSFNTTFLSILSKQQGVTYPIFLAYFIKLFPKSIPLLEELRLLTTDDEYKKSVEHHSRKHLDDNLKILHISDLPNVNIREDMVQVNVYPYIEGLSFLYEKYLTNKYLNRKQTKKLFKDYFNKVHKFQQAELKFSMKNNDYRYHPFSVNNHNTSILSVFINYTFNRDINKQFKPVYTSNYIIKFYQYLQINNLGFSKLRNNHYHYKQLNSLVGYFLDIKNLKFDINIALELVDTLLSRDIYLETKVYIQMIDALISVNMMNDAKKIYDHIVQNRIIASKLQWYQVSPYCEKYRWKYPRTLLKQVEDLSIDEIENLKAGDTLIKNTSYKFDKDFLTKESSPEEFVKLLDTKLGELQSNGNV